MNRNYTPGPWAYEKEGRSFQVFSTNDPEYLGKKLSLLTIYQEDGKSFGHVFKEDDARLIASAPEMRDALDTALATLRSYQFGNSSTELAKDVADHISKVISNAERRAS